jgi:hypothetical protein
MLHILHIVTNNTRSSCESHVQDFLLHPAALCFGLSKLSISPHADSQTLALLPRDAMLCHRPCSANRCSASLMCDWTSSLLCETRSTSGAHHHPHIICRVLASFHAYIILVAVLSAHPSGLPSAAHVSEDSWS